MNRVGKSVGILAGEQVLQVILTASTGILVARALGPETFGTFSFATSVTAMVLPLLSVGQSILVRDLVIAPERRPEVLRAAIRVALGIAVLLQVLAVAFAVLLPNRLATARVPVVICAIGLVIRPALILDFWFQSRLDARGAASSRLVGLTVGSVLRVGIAMYGGNNVVPLLAAATVADSLVAGALMLRRYRRWGGDPKTLLLGAARTWSYFQRIFPLLVAGLSVALYVRLDQILLGIMAGPGELGQYAVAVRFSELLYFVPVVIMNSVAPGLSELQARDEARFEAAYERVVAGFVAVAVLSVICLIVVAPILFSTLFGPAYRDASSVFRIHVLSLPFVFLGLAQSVWNAVYEQQRLAMWRTLGGVGINVALCLLLIPAHGAMGAAYATIIAYAFSGFIGNACFPRTRSFFALQVRQLWPTTLARSIVRLKVDVIELARK